MAFNGISKVEQEFFEAGGTGILGGDGNLNYGWETRRLAGGEGRI